MEQKSKALSLFDFVGCDFVNHFGWYEIRAHQAWRYMKSIAPIGRGVRIVCNEFASINPIIRDRETLEIINDPSPNAQLFLDLIKRPNFDKTFREFMFSLCSSFIVTGEIYIMCTGVNKPQELFFFNPGFINVVPGSNGIPKSISYNDSFQSFFFKPEESGANFEFRSSDGSKKIYQISDFNPRYANEQRGLSRLSAVYYEIEQYIRTSIHNISTLRKGARPSGVLTLASAATKEQKDYLRKQISAFYSGDQNAGNVMVLDGGKDFQQLSISAKDMDFEKLKQRVNQALYEALEIPASFYDNSASTFNNKESDRLNLYDFAVLPIADRIYDELSYIMHQQLPDTQDVIVSFNLQDIPALQPRFNAQLKAKANIGVSLINELRNQAGDESIGPEGDVLYQPLSLVPVGTSPIVPSNEKSQASIIATKRFRDILKRKGFTDTQIKEYEKFYAQGADN